MQDHHQIVRPNISPDVSPEKAREQARTDATLLHGWKLAVILGLAGVIPGLIIVFRREGSSAFGTAVISALATWVSLGLVVLGQWVYCRLTARGRVLALRLNHAAAIIQECETFARRNDDALEQYRADDPRVEVTKVVTDDIVPYTLYVTVRVENPGEPTNLRFWQLHIARRTGEKITGHMVNEDSSVCRVGKSDHTRTPLEPGGTTEGRIRFDCDQPVFALDLGPDTQFTASCQTIKQVRVQGVLARAPTTAPYSGYVASPALDKVLQLPPDPTRSLEECLGAARTLYDRSVEECVDGDEEAKRRLISGLGQDLVYLSRYVHGMTMGYLQDFNRVRDGSKRCGWGHAWWF